MFANPALGQSPVRDHFRWVLYVDNAVTTVPSEFTSLKTTHREMYDAARTRMMESHERTKSEKMSYDEILHRDNPRPPSAGKKSVNQPELVPEILLQGPAGEVLEGSLTTPYFFRNNRWVTPPVVFGAGGQQGTTRRWALARGLCVEEPVLAETVKPGEIVWLSNGVRGFGAGLVMGNCV